MASVTLDFLVFRPVTTHAQGGEIHYLMVRPGTDQRSVKMEGSVVGFTCLSTQQETQGNMFCFIATR